MGQNPLEACIQMEYYSGNLTENMTAEEVDIRYSRAEEICKVIIAKIVEKDHNTYVRELITYYLMGIGGMTVCCLGLIGNILSLVVLSQKSMRSSTYSYLAALAVCDLLVLVFTMVLLVKDVKRPEEGHHRWPWDEGIYPYLFPVLHPAAFTFQVTSVWLTLAFTVDRYIMICHPFEAEPFCTVSRARKVIAILYVGGIIFNIPKYFEYRTRAILTNPVENITKIGCDLTELGKSHVFRELYHSWFYIAFVCGVPFVSLAVLNAFLIHAVRLSRQRGKEINVAERKRNDTTVMLISVVVVFFICQMPALVSRMIWAFEDDPATFTKLHLYALNEACNFLVILNSAINIVPYYFFGRRFRKQFWRLFCRCLLKYKRFQTLTRSFSITVLDATRKDSNGSLPETTRLRPHMTTGGPHSSAEAIKMKQLLSADLGEPPRKTSTMSTASDCCYDKHEKLHVGGRGLQGAGCVVGEVNGNCRTKDPALHCLLERE